MWLEQSLNQFRETLLNYYQPNRATGHAPLERTMGAGVGKGSGTEQQQQQQPFGGSGASTPSSTSTATASTVTSSPMRKNILESLGKLMSACVVLRIEDFTLHRVTTAEKKQMPKEFISGEWGGRNNVELLFPKFCFLSLCKRFPQKNHAKQHCKRGRLTGQVED